MSETIGQDATESLLNTDRHHRSIQEPVPENNHAEDDGCEEIAHAGIMSETREERRHTVV